MEAVAEGLWLLAERFEEGGCIPQAVKCLEALCQSQVSFLPILEVKTRLRIATILLNHTDNVTHAKNHLERAQLLLKQIPSCFELKCRAYSLLSRCYHLVGTIPPQKQTLKKALDLATGAGEGESSMLWACNFNLQLANALTTEGDFRGAIKVLECGVSLASKVGRSDLEMVFSTSILHVHLMQWEDTAVVQEAVAKCDEIWDSMPSAQRKACHGLHLYNELLHTFYTLRICDYKQALVHVEALDATLKVVSKSEAKTLPAEQLSGSRKRQSQGQSEGESNSGIRNSNAIFSTNFELGPAPLGGEWLPKGAVSILVDLMAVMCARPKGYFDKCNKRLSSGISQAQDELQKLGITTSATEVDLQHWAIWVSGVYLILLLQLIENKVIIELTRTEFSEAQKSLVQMLDWFNRFPTILQGCETTIHMLVGHYAHSLGCFSEAATHFQEAARLTESKGLQAMCQIYAAISYICIGDADSSSLALDLIGPIYRSVDSFVGLREKTAVWFAAGVVQMKQHNLQEARSRLSNGLTITHKQWGNIQLVSQYLMVLGSSALALHDTGQALDILKSSLTLAKTLHDVPTQIGVLSELTALYRELGDPSKELENSEYEGKRSDDLKNRIKMVQASDSHLSILKFGV
ncbi:hypothetical protein KP509_33G031900 [Ceratopteris richardii]|uniref:Tetratricopeptide repeat (TPR)-like superfamily protein n=2 Tax=Ceratopteris richardii TaxID=49495 RepID=A0A8T2QNW9_CERRI|nr:hypothetical protein KP509_33G031900 [Ceratopteris richardii]